MNKQHAYAWTCSMQQEWTCDKQHGHGVNKTRRNLKNCNYSIRPKLRNNTPIFLYLFITVCPFSRLVSPCFSFRAARFEAKQAKQTSVFSLPRKKNRFASVSLCFCFKRKGKAHATCRISKRKKKILTIYLKIRETNCK